MRIAWITFLLVWGPGPTGLPPERTSISQEPKELPDSFQGQGGRTVGRLAIRLMQGDLTKQVGLDHRFRSGERFKFEVTSNQDGWLVIYHQSNGGKPGKLWPPPKAKDTAIRAGTTTLIPPSGAFKFDEQTGDEWFYVAVVSDRQALKTLAAEYAGRKYEAPQGQPPQATGTRKKRNYSVRGLAKRGVTYDPEPEELDLHVYFSASAQDDDGVAVMRFKLMHRE